ncbi:MAG: hypothetical protein ACT4O1_11440 [Gemmatimonadota bacterium]
MQTANQMRVLVAELLLACSSDDIARPPVGAPPAGRPTLPETYRPTGHAAAGAAFVHLFEWKWTDIASECETPYFFLEVIAGGNEALSARDYFGAGYNSGGDRCSGISITVGAAGTIDLNLAANSAIAIHAGPASRQSP